MIPQLLPEDYYTNENGLLVFTRVYHLKRGYCCGSGCKHCPYAWENVNETKKAQLVKVEPFNDLTKEVPKEDCF